MEGHELAQDLAVALMHGIQWQLFVAKFVRIVCSRQKATEAYDSRWERGRTTGADTRELLLCVLRHECRYSICAAYALHDNSANAERALCILCVSFCLRVCWYWRKNEGFWWRGKSGCPRPSMCAQTWRLGKLPNGLSVLTGPLRLRVR